MSATLTSHEIGKEENPALEQAIHLAQRVGVYAETLDRVRMSAPSGWSCQRYVDAILAEDDVSRDMDGEPRRGLRVAVLDTED